MKTRTVFLHVHALIDKNYSFHANICYLLLLKEFRGHHGILYPRSSPFFQLEKEVIFSKHEPKRECDAENNEKSGGEVLEGNVLLRVIPKKCYSKRSKAAACRELLKQIEILTFVVYGNDALDHLYDPLSADLKDFSRHASPPPSRVPVEDNLVVEKAFDFRNQTKKCPPLSKPKEKKTALSGRVRV